VRLCIKYRTKQLQPTLKNWELLTINSRHELQFLFDAWYSTICIFAVHRGQSIPAANAHLLFVVYFVLLALLVSRHLKILISTQASSYEGKNSRCKKARNCHLKMSKNRDVRLTI
jgi:hypothetical protein